MLRPMPRAEGIVLRRPSAARVQILVQCDADESFYRFSGGSIEFGEAASTTIVRELIEEYELEVRVGRLAAVSEAVFTYDNQVRHQVTLLHWCTLMEPALPTACSTTRIQLSRWCGAHWRNCARNGSCPRGFSRCSTCRQERSCMSPMGSTNMTSPNWPRQQGCPGYRRQTRLSFFLQVRLGNLPIDVIEATKDRKGDDFPSL